MNPTLPPFPKLPHLPLFIRKRKENLPRKSTSPLPTRYISSHSENPQIQLKKPKTDPKSPLLQRRIFEFTDSFHKKIECIGTFFTTQEVDNDIETDQ